jgi:hypothetical protein
MAFMPLLLWLCLLTLVACILWLLRQVLGLPALL